MIKKAVKVIVEYKIISRLLKGLLKGAAFAGVAIGLVKGIQALRN